MKRAFLPFLFTITVIIILATPGCGGYTPPPNSTTTNPGSGIKNRVLITNEIGSNQLGFVQIVDATADALGGGISVGAHPRLIAFSATAKVTLVYDSNDNGVRIIDNTTETVTGQVGLPGFTESLVITPDGKTGYAAMPALGQVAVIDVSGKAFASANPIGGIPGARRLVMANTGSKVLAFSDGSNALAVINVADNSVATSATQAALGTFDRPYSAVFSTDDSKAYILNCGPECGGTTAGVTVLNIGASNSYTIGTTTAVPGGATVGALDGSNLYVAGTPLGAGQGQGKISVINPGTLAMGNSASISDGLHTTLAVASNGRVYVGSRTCTSVPLTAATPAGCLSMYNISANTAALSGSLGDVTGVLPIKNRTVIYVIEGGELVIYDTSTDKPQAKQVDVVGHAVEGRQIDQ